MKKDVLSEIEDIQKFKDFGIGVIYFYGSYAQSRGGQMSDFDIGVVFKNPEALNNLAEIHPQLYDIFTGEFPTTFQNDVDIAYLQRSSLSFQYTVIKEGKVIYESDSLFRVDYEEKLIKDYLDFQPIQRVFSQALLERRYEEVSLK